MLFFKQIELFFQEKVDFSNNKIEGTPILKLAMVKR